MRNKVHKLLVIVFVFVIIFNMTGCNEDVQGKSFDNVKEMQSYLSGIWQLKDMSMDKDKYYMFSKDKIFEFGTDNISIGIQSYLSSLTKESYKKFENANIEDSLTYLLGYIEKDYRFLCSNYEYNHEKGIIDFSKDGNEDIMIIGDDKIYFKGYEEYIYKKISDKPVFDEEIFGEIYRSIKDNYKIPLEKYLLSTNDCAEKLKEKYPEINSYILVSDDGTKIYTNNGAVSSDKSFLVSDVTVLFSKKNASGQYIYLYELEKESITVRDTSGATSLEDLIKDALICVSEYPNALTVDELLSRFENEAQVKSGTYDLNITESGITYRILKTTSFTSKDTVVMITFK